MNIYDYSLVTAVLCLFTPSVYIGCSAATKFCDELEQTIRYTIGDTCTVRITSPNYPNSHAETPNCVINIVVGSKANAAFRIEHRNDERTGDKCDQYYYLYDTDNQKIPTEQTCNSHYLTIYGLLKTNRPWVKLKLFSTPGAAFELDFTALPLHSLRPDTIMLSAFSEPSAYITSHRNFSLQLRSSYSTNLNNSLIITNLGDQVTGIRLEFLYMALGLSYDSCQPTPDILKIYEIVPGTPTLLYQCGDVYRSSSSNLQAEKLSTSPAASSILFQFITDDDDQYQTEGFLIRYSITFNSSIAPSKDTTMSLQNSLPTNSTTETDFIFSTEVSESAITSSITPTASSQPSTSTLTVVIISVIVLIIIVIGVGLLVFCIIRIKRKRRSSTQEEIDEDTYEEIDTSGSSIFTKCCH